MKNENYVKSVDRISPDEAARERMLGRILDAAHTNQSKTRKVNSMTRTLNWKRPASVAACFVLVIALIGVFGNNAGWFGGKVYTANLGGDTISFHKANVPGEDSLHFDFDVTSRELTADEIKVIFGKMTATAYATFNAENRSLVRLEGNVGDTKVIVAAAGTPVSDTVIEGGKNVSDVNGVPVAAGYFITNANSQGLKTIIYFASWTLGDATEYVEISGDEADGETLSAELAAIIEQLIQNGVPDLGRIVG